MTEDLKIHASDCAVHNMPAYPNGPCDCREAADVVTVPIKITPAMAYELESNFAECVPPSDVHARNWQEAWSRCLAASPVQPSAFDIGELTLALERLANDAEKVRRMLHADKERQGPAMREIGIPFVASINNATDVLARYDLAALRNPEREG